MSPQNVLLFALVAMALMTGSALAQSHSSSSAHASTDSGSVSVFSSSSSGPASAGASDVAEQTAVSGVASKFGESVVAALGGVNVNEEARRLAVGIASEVSPLVLRTRVRHT